MFLLKAATEAPINWTNFWVSIGSIVVSIIVILVSYFNTRATLRSSNKNIERTLAANRENTEMTLRSKRIEEKKNEIYKKLNEFYGPFYQLRSKSQLLYNKFVQKYKSEQTTTEHFRTLTYLLEGGVVEGNEKILLDEIIKIGEKCEALIHDKAGLIDDEDLRIKWLPMASTHYLILRLAYKGQLHGEAEKFKLHTFPMEIDALIEKRIKELQKELEELA